MIYRTITISKKSKKPEKGDLIVLYKNGKGKVAYRDKDSSKEIVGLYSKNMKILVNNLY